MPDSTEVVKEKSRANKRRDRKDKIHHSTKIVVRHLPPTMTENEFLEQVDPLPENDTYYYCPADWSLGQEATCRVYISFKDVEDVIQFRDRFDGYVFVDTKGAEYVAIVEYAPFQSFLKNKSKHDNKVNTIASELHYQEFLQKLDDEREEASRLGDIKIDFLLDRRTEEKVKSTPLLQYLANKKEKRREDARRRNEEKRKQREEHKVRQAEQEKDKDKSKELPSESKKSVGGNAKKGASKDTNGPEEDTKSSRSKRRAERFRERREEREQRKMQREQKGSEKSQSTKPTKDAKQNKQANKDKEKGNKEIKILKKENKTDVKQCANPADSKKADGGDAIVKKDDYNTDKKSNKIEKNKRVVESVKKTEAVVTEEEYQSQSNELSGDNSELAAQRALEERRVRNKDRPSIAIYQPKPRTRKGSVDNTPNTSNRPNSDGEASIPDEQLRKKNKRAARRNRQKEKAAESKDSSENILKSEEKNTAETSSNEHGNTAEHVLKPSEGKTSPIPKILLE